MGKDPLLTHLLSELFYPDLAACQEGPVGGAGWALPGSARLHRCCC